ncbi:MAG: response regulator [Candidatus Omnitrophota bacterium]|nr:response regulator [Candidatus Omnitrophota bacterium]
MVQKILIVDDEKITVDFLAGMLRLKGYEVFKSFDSGSALRIIEKESINLVLLDMRLLGMNGLEVLKTFRRDYPLIKVIVITGYGSEYKQKIMKVGCEAYFSKPILIEAVKAKIENLLFDHSSRIPGVSGNLTDDAVVFAEDIIPKADILLIEPRPAIRELLLGYFLNFDYCKGLYQISSIDIKEKIFDGDFIANIILVDVDITKIFGEFSFEMMNFKNSPCEIITFGEPAEQWDELDVMLKRGIIVNSALWVSGAESSYKVMLEQVNNSMKAICVKNKLYVRDT